MPTLPESSRRGCLVHNDAAGACCALAGRRGSRVAPQPCLPPMLHVDYFIFQPLQPGGGRSASARHQREQCLQASAVHTCPAARYSCRRPGALPLRSLCTAPVPAVAMHGQTQWPTTHHSRQTAHMHDEDGAFDFGHQAVVGKDVKGGGPAPPAGVQHPHACEEAGGQAGGVGQVCAGAGWHRAGMQRSGDTRQRQRRRR